MVVTDKGEAGKGDQVNLLIQAEKEGLTLIREESSLKWRLIRGGALWRMGLTRRELILERVWLISEAKQRIYGMI